MWLKWLPLKFIFRRLAHSHGFIDPISILSNVRRFSQPSEVKEPIELLRAGVVLHARGLINSQVIQHNLDWVWPFWVNQQFDPQKKSFVPRSFTMTTINLTARNWTAVGIPSYSQYPVVDPRGLVMPFWDSWSVDAWIIDENGNALCPSRVDDVEQELIYNENLSVSTCSKYKDKKLFSDVKAELAGESIACSVRYKAVSESPGWLVFSIRPFNPEGISFINTIEFEDESQSWLINEKESIYLNDPPDKNLISNFKRGDVFHDILKHDEIENRQKIKCEAGMATAASLYRFEPGKEKTIEFLIQHDDKSIEKPLVKSIGVNLWQEKLEECCKIDIDYENFKFLFDTAIRSVILHSPKDIYPGPYTYKRFWYRDAAIIVYSMVKAGLLKHAEKMIDNFMQYQTPLGYFHSQEGEWDSNGQVLWVINEYLRHSGDEIKEDWLKSIVSGAKWIIRKRTSKSSGKDHAGLLPAGFSAEHFGPSDYYYWDDFWAVAGLRSAAQMVRGSEYNEKAEEFLKEADDLEQSIDRSLKKCSKRLGRKAMPVSVYRRLDSAAIGSLVCCYPLGLMDMQDERVADTVEYLMYKCIVQDCYYHDIAHSGINPYLTILLVRE